MGTPLKNPPVFMTLAQVRFNPILKLDDYLPTIQESFRRADFTDFDVESQFTIRVKIQDKQSIPETSPQKRYIFGNAKNTHVFILDTQALTIQSTDYGQFESFSETFLKGLDIVHNAVQLAYTERIGLRYLDRVMPQSGEAIDLYLANQVQGLASNLGGKPIYSYTEAMNEVGNIRLISRVVISDGPLAFPPDLQPQKLVVADKFVSYSGPAAVLDNDGFIEARENFSSQKIHDDLDKIHKVIGTAFKATATQHAFTVWDT